MQNQLKSDRVEINILGQRMVLKAGDDPKRVERIASYVKRKVEEVSTRGPVSSSKVALLVALNIAEDYFQLNEDFRKFKQQVSNKSHVLLNDLEDLSTSLSE